MSVNARWEYRVTQINFILANFDSKKPKNAEALKHMNKMGQHGWELVQSNVNNTGVTTCFWKREMKGPVDEWDD